MFDLDFENFYPIFGLDFEKKSVFLPQILKIRIVFALNHEKQLHQQAH